MKKTWFYYLYNLDLFLSVIGLIALIIITFLGVFMRYLLNAPFTWQDEMQMMLIIWITCFGSSAAFRSGGHVAIDMVADLLPQRYQKALTVGIYLVVLFVLCFLTWNGWEFVRQQFENKRVSDILGIQRGFVYLPLPVSAVLMLLNFTVVTLKGLRSKSEITAGGEPCGG